jgi:hypothetical protein
MLLGSNVVDIDVGEVDDGGVEGALVVVMFTDGREVGSDVEG